MHYLSKQRNSTPKSKAICGSDTEIKMSDLTPCNYCSYQGIKRRAKEKGLVITKKRHLSATKIGGKDHYMGGVNIYRHKKGETIDHDKHFISWFMELPDSCKC